MLDEHDGHAEFLMDVPDVPQHLLDLTGIESGGYLVQQQQFGVGRQRSGHRHALLGGDREFADEDAGEFGQVQQAQHGFRLFEGGAPGGGAQEAAHHHVVLHGEVSGGSVNLEGPRHAAPCDLVGGELGDILTVEADGSRGGRVMPGEAVEERGLARAVGTDEAQHLPGVERKRNVLVGPQPSEVLGESVDLQQRHHLLPRRRSRSMIPQMPRGSVAEMSMMMAA